MTPADVQEILPSPRERVCAAGIGHFERDSDSDPAKGRREGADAADVAAAQALADSMEAKLAAGAKFEDLVKTPSTDPNAPRKDVAPGSFGAEG